MNDGAGGFLNSSYASNRPSGMTASDLDADGIIDLIITNYNPYITASVMLGNGDGTFNLPLAYPAGGGNPEFPVAVDLNNDGFPDLITANRGGDSISVLINLTTDQLLGDMDCDGQLTEADGPAMALALVDLLEYETTYVGCNPLNGDIDSSGILDGRDLQGFVEVLLGL